MGFINFSKDKCRNCYKCIRNCPVKAIKLKDKHAQIISSICIGCGYCIKICPHNAKEIHSDVEQVKRWFETDEVVVSLSEIFPATCKMDHPRQYITALRQLGFTIIEESSIGAEAIVAENEKQYKSSRDFVISSSCAAIKNLIEMYYPQYIDNLTPVVSPMIAHGKIIREKYPHAKIIHIGACLARKMEALDDSVKGVIDAVLTYDEIDQWFQDLGIDPQNTETGEFDAIGGDSGRSYPMGLVNSRVDTLQGSRKIIRIDGIENCMHFLDEIGKLQKQYWIEMNACEEGCINGPGNMHSLLSKYEKIEMMNTYIDLNKEKRNQLDVADIDLVRDFIKRPVHHLKEVPEKELEDILKQMGKFSDQDELNCGTCGYDTCRDKARAVYWNMADIEMCLPLILSKSEAISNLIVTTTPNAIAVLDKKFRIIEFNDAAERLFNVKRQDVFHYSFMDAMDYNPFKKLDHCDDNLYTGKGVYEREDRVFMEILTYIPVQELYMGIFIDITKEERQEKIYMKMQEETLSMAQRVIDKQMRVAHEIAGLLGETTAETKVTLTNLQKVIRDREDEF